MNKSTRIFNTEKLIVIAFFLGGIVGIWSHLQSVKSMLESAKVAQEKITECEATLSRNEHCTLVAMPISKD